MEIAPVTKHLALLFAAAVCPTFLSAQDKPAPGGAPAAAAAPAKAAVKGEAIRYALVEADGGKRGKVTNALEEINGLTPEARAQFFALRARLAKAAPAESRPASRPEGAAAPAATGAAPEGPAKPVEFAPATKELMNAAAAMDEAASAAALAKLAALGADGVPALTQLGDRSMLLAQRLMSAAMKKEISTGALYAGQYAGLKEFGRDAIPFLLKWTTEPPRDVLENQAENFKGAAVRALRDLDPSPEEKKSLAKALRGAAGRAQQSGNDDLVFTVAGACRAFGDSTIFDAIKEQATKASKSDKAQERYSGFKALSDLHYSAREHAEAAAAYKSLVAVGEEMKLQPAQLGITYYNAACNFALANNADEAFAMLDKALSSKAQGINQSLLDNDRDLTNLRADPRFSALVKKAFPPPAPAPTPAPNAPPAPPAN
jgi:hypothetical protein